jgi:hypothetical protein
MAIPMTFTFEDQQFRIVFHHEPSRRLVDHLGHDVEIRRSSVNGKFKPAEIVCWKCAKKTGGPLRLAPLTRSEQRRNTVCVIMTQIQGKWVATDFLGVSRLNMDAGDQFSRQAGREAALRDTLTPLLDHMAPLLDHNKEDSMCGQKPKGQRRSFRGTVEFRTAVLAAFRQSQAKAAK